MFVGELNEEGDINQIPADQRRLAAHALWVYRPPFRMAHFKNKVLDGGSNEAEHPLLAQFLKDEDLLRGLTYMPQAFEFVSLCSKRYGRRLTSDKSRELTVGDCLAEQPPQQQRIWESAFSGYRHAWNLSRRPDGVPMTEARYDWRLRCDNCPNNEDVNESSSLALCLPYDPQEGGDDFPEGKLVMAFLDTMVTHRHNAMVHLVQNGAAAGQELEEMYVSSEHFSSAHTLDYDMEGGFKPFLEKLCVFHSTGGAVDYDFVTAERYLSNLWISKPQIMLKVGFEYLDQQKIYHDMEFLSSLIPQAPLPRQAVDAIKKDITLPAQAQQCLEVLLTCISFLATTGKGGGLQSIGAKGVASKPLAQYAADTLHMSEDKIGSRAIVQYVQLSHLLHLKELLEVVTQHDPMEAVSMKYKVTLDGALADKLMKAAPEMQLDTLVPAIKDLVLKSCVGENTDANSSMRDFMDWLEVDVGGERDFLSSIGWYDDHFPAEMKMMHALDVYNMLNEFVGPDAA